MKSVSRPAPTVSAKVGLFIAHAASKTGVPEQQLFKATGFTPSNDPDARIPLALETELWNTAEKLSNDADFGLHAAENIRPGAFDVFDYAVRTAPNLASALQRMVRYNRLVHDLATFNVVEQSNKISIEHRFSSADIRPCRHASEFTLASLLVIGEQMTGHTLRPHAVSFAHSQPERTTEHLRIFSVMPSFDAPISSLTLPLSVLALPIPDADPGLSRIVMAHAEQLLVAMSSTMPDTVTAVCDYLTQHMAQGPMTLSQVAAHMHMSERSLQRHLANEGTQFAKLADDVRKELALRYISDQHLALGEVAYLLGFSEPSPFHRAFKRWTGMTPAAARKTGLSKIPD